MRKLLALLLLICILISSSACTKSNDNEPDDNSTNENQPSTDGGDTDGSDVVTIVVPDYKDYGRNTVNFNEIVYSRPSMQAVIEAFESATAAVKDQSTDVTDKIDLLRSLEGPLNNVQTMYSLAEIYRSKNSSDEFWQTEYTYITTNYPKLTQSVEELIVACAISEHREFFESDYFGYSLEKYVDGGIYTDEAVALMAEEAELEAQYSSLSKSTVKIKYQRTGTEINWEGTVDEVTAMAREYFANDDKKFNDMLMLINSLYEAKLAEIQKNIYIDLIKVRRGIADALGYSSYRDLAYNSQDYSYSYTDMLSLLDDIGNYLYPVAYSLENIVFSSYFLSNPQPQLDTTSLINTLYEVYSDLGGEYKDAYSYMLQHGLYDVSGTSDTRFNGAFTVYVENNSSPYVFMSASGFIKDYATLSHEFGHFLDGYINYGEGASLTISEVSSQALELLTLLELKGNIKSAHYEYLEYYTLYSFLKDALLSQSFYATFEHLVYELEYDDITESRLNRVVEEAMKKVYGDDLEVMGNVSYVTVPHTVLYPFYVESYVTSGLVSLEIFFAESHRTGNKGDGFDMYEALIKRDDNTLAFEDALDGVGLSSPFSSKQIKDISNNLYYQIIGKTYYKDSDNQNDAA